MNSNSALYACVTGILLAPLYGIGQWAYWQHLKRWTVIPYGMTTGLYGGLICIILKTLCVLIIVTMLFVLRWWVIVAFIVMWVVAGFFARALERFLYGTEDRLKMLEYHAQKLSGATKTDNQLYLKWGQPEFELYSKWNRSVPRWWVNIMSEKWEEKYKETIGKYIKSIDPSDPLFDISLASMREK
ncbi:MAG: hypothetical protein A3I73_00890 [Omnitrophica bacterium RIFCSPLOWO2_02_FULL_45_16]|nr:MAG: hypothetical protein A3C51_04320 [Omnitrophica bacterium RIFCSPHIGHO2_02_FULL_46_20]OGX00761.1 MAG: hypothetical protein A3I73_00890 [Omnitrophica bacterium RIFCSPLOWO2_02_FULL_45_16]